MKNVTNQGTKTHTAPNNALIQVMVISFLLTSTAMAAPDGAEIGVGKVEIVGQGSGDVVVHQYSDRAVINWKTFDTDEKERVTFKQPDASSIAVNIVHSGAATRFDGAMEANGHVILINTNGVIFGKSARVDVAGLVATTVALDKEKFSEKGALYFNNEGKNEKDAKIVNRGHISVAEAGLVAFVSPVVRNSGVIEANVGTVHLASGDVFAIDLGGDGLVSLAMHGDVERQLIQHTGEIHAAKGQVYITAAMGKKIVDDVINMKGFIEAPKVETFQGTIYIKDAKEEGSVKEEDPVVEAPVAEVPTVEEPVPEVPVVEEPTEEEPVVPEDGTPVVDEESGDEDEPVVLVDGTPVADEEPAAGEEDVTVTAGGSLIESVMPLLAKRKKYIRYIASRVEAPNLDAAKSMHIDMKKDELYYDVQP